MSKRVGLRISEKLDDWFANQAEEMGIPKSSVMAMALHQYAIQYQSLSAIAQINELAQEDQMKKLEGLEEDKIFY